MPVREFHQVKQRLFVSLQLLLNSISLNWLTYHRTHKTIRQINHDIFIRSKSGILNYQLYFSAEASLCRREAGEREKEESAQGIKG